MPRPADVLAGSGSLAAKLKARREAIEAGYPEQAEEAYRRGEWRDASVDGAVNNEKQTYDDVDLKKHLRY